MESAPKRGGVLAGTKLDPVEVAKLLYNAGWTSPFDLLTMVATVAMESAFYTEAYNDNNNGTRDVGLCQINIAHDQIGTAYEESLKDPVTNVAAARKLYEARGFQPWYAYTGGNYKLAYKTAAGAVTDFFRSLQPPPNYRKILSGGFGHLDASTLYAAWRKANPNEAAALDHYKADGNYPAIKTAFGQFLREVYSAFRQAPH